MSREEQQGHETDRRQRGTVSAGNQLYGKIVVKGRLMPKFYWFTDCSLVTALTSYSPDAHWSVHYNSSFGSYVAFTFNNLCPDRAEGLRRQADGGEPPITCQHCQGQCLIISSLLAAIHVIHHAITSLCGPYQIGRRGPGGDARR